MKQFSLVSFYKRKPKVLQLYIAELLEVIGKSLLGEYFEAYQMDQIHATLIGLEQIEMEGKLYNRNFWEHEQQKQVVHSSGFNDLIREYFPLTIRFGGFASDDQSFLSRGSVPYERSFRIDFANKRIVIMGWPWSIKGQQNSLDNFRMEMEKRCHIRHKYPRDNDFYMVLGKLLTEKQYSSVQLGQVENQVREYMSCHPLEIVLDYDHLNLVQYADETLPLDTTATSKFPFVL